MPIWPSPERQSATTEPTQPTRCASSPGCGGDDCGRDVHPVAPGIEALHAVAVADHRLARTASALSTRARLRARTGVSKSRTGELSAVRRPRCHRDDRALLLDLF